MMHVAWLLLLTSVLLGGSGDARAEAWQELRISDIAISGNRYIEKETILDRIHLRKGMFFDRKAVSQDVKRIYRTGFFSDVRVEGHRRGNGVALEYRVKEYPLIAKVEISGNDEVTTKDLKLRLKLKPGQIFNPRNRQADINTIRKGYIKKGYYQVAVDISAKPAENGRVNVHIKIDEGVKTHIRRIRFIGNRAVDDATLRGRIASSEQSLATWITDRDIFDRKRVAADVQMIEQYYQNQGFLDARVESTSTRLSSDRQGFDISYSIHEGPRYTLGEIRLQGDLVPDRATLEREITLKQGDVYSLKALRETIMKLTETVGDEGYAYATVTPLFKRDLANRIVDITLDIDKGREVYVERIDIAGNASTNDYVIRRELRQDEGARYSATAVRRSKERLKRLPYIEDVRVAMPKGSSPHKAKMRVDVTEKKSGSVSFGVGYSQVEKVFFQGKYNEKNVFGMGYQANLDGTIGAQTQNVQASLTDPYFFGQDISATLTAYRHNNQTQQYTSYDISNGGVNLGFSLPFSEHLNYNISYGYDISNLRNIPAGASIVIQAQKGRQTTSMLSQSVSFDDRDRVIGPAHGSLLTAGVNAAGPGGSNYFLEAFADASTYLTLDMDGMFILAPHIGGRVIRAWGGRRLPLNRRYSLGGVGSVRGFDAYGISLRDPVTGDALGGDRQVTANLNLYFPIPGMKTAGFRGVLFADAGVVWGSVSATVAGATINVTEPFAMSKVRASVGWGFEWMSPMGPLGFVWGFPVKKQPGDIKRQFEFSIGANF